MLLSESTEMLYAPGVQNYSSYKLFKIEIIQVNKDLG